MVAKFRRSLSFPNNNNQTSSKPTKTLHVRSTSLPCRSHHPIISLLKDQINDLKSSSSSSSSTIPNILCHRLTQLKTIHESLEDLLHLPQTKDSLRNQFNNYENLLEDFLHFLDVYGTFQTLLLSLKQQLSSTQVAIRSKNIKFEDYIKTLKKLAKKISGLSSTIRLAGADNQSGDTELGEVIRDVKEVTITVSIALFSGVSKPFLPEKKGWRFGLRLNKRVKIDHHQEICLMGLLRKKGEELQVKMVLKRMHELENWIDEIESFSEKIYRSLINTRVSLLNVLTN
ncbi:uncharacterized protein LOC124912481 [Impatiens glandulifera]|uniref:uncharacterized protein LOC124912481 n=1 Tax=Impatiens glandulifera TaxID=253017 RepID=UPI001FB073CE|nr:uncharacterized protein LOC124912481 [Impatiens glandulifera]